MVNITSQKHIKIAKRLAELGNPTRLHIFRFLVKAGNKGKSVGEIREKLQIPGSTLSHHINRLISVDLISQQRCGNALFCKPNMQHLNDVMLYLQRECCLENK